jgi:hypothetical protein
MKGVIHFLRAALVGFAALFTVAALFVAADVKNAEERLQDRIEKLAHDRGLPQDSDDLRRDATAQLAQEALGMMLQLGVFGAMFCAAALAILRVTFPVGPASKVVVGAVIGPFLPLLLFSASQIKEGKAGDLPGLVVLGLIAGVLAGILEANRVGSRHSQTHAPAPDPPLPQSADR